ncbi:uncharacterized protein LOC123559592 [Mercenaria mercenaria]|uniref:uncharacterized protein LOC123559592 n=1 Tax=Mercenaria mercenaria TaxID=6596 RepID=UPI001E1D6159|nr:uncharacterized protein LOC123559592 [Mercenaria mercenaria]
MTKNSVLRAEILWTLKLLTTHQSYKSSENSDKLFRTMFPDSTIASQFKCGERKAAYLTVFGLGEHFMSLLKNRVNGPYVIIFDESLNKKMQEKQMDLFVRFWDDELKKIETRYYSSQFLGHATSDDMVEHFTKAMSDHKLNMGNLLQIGMDRPNVNWKFLDIMKQKIRADYGSDLINIGSCGVHTVHNIFKAGFSATGWRIGDLLSSLYYLFKDSCTKRRLSKDNWIKYTPSEIRAAQVAGKCSSCRKSTIDH